MTATSRSPLIGLLIVLAASCSCVVRGATPHQWPVCTKKTPCSAGPHYFCLAGNAKNGCSPSNPFPAADCTSQCRTVAASPPPKPPSPKPHSSRPPSPTSHAKAPSPRPPSPRPHSRRPPAPLGDNTDCTSAVNCPMDGATYWFCSSGAASGGCQPASQGSFPAGSCSAQCTFSSTNPKYTPAACPAGTGNSCPTDGPYFFCVPTGQCRPVAQGWFPAPSCSNQCLLSGPSTAPPPNAAASPPSPSASASPPPSGGGQSRTRTFRVVNKCSTSVWVAAIANNGGNQANPTLLNGATSWELPAGSPTAPTTLSMSVQAGTSGRLWGRTGCGDNGSGGGWKCQTGDCNSQQACTLSGEAPATLFEWTFTSTQDIYDMSAVDGYNLAMTVKPTGPFVSTPNAPCTSPGCTLDTSTCAPETVMQVGGGAPNACLSICAAIYNAAQRAQYPILQSIYSGTTSTGKPMRDLVCCACGDSCGAGCSCGTAGCNFGCSPYASYPPSPPWTTSVCRVEDWPLASNGQMYTAALANACKGVYNWQFDDANGLHFCTQADYEITFC